MVVHLFWEQVHEGSIPSSQTIYASILELTDILALEAFEEIRGSSNLPTCTNTESWQRGLMQHFAKVSVIYLAHGFESHAFRHKYGSVVLIGRIFRLYRKGYGFKSLSQLQKI